MTKEFQLLIDGVPFESPKESNEAAMAAAWEVEEKADKDGLEDGAWAHQYEVHRVDDEDATE
jgi:hypothetical protein